MKLSRLHLGLLNIRIFDFFLYVTPNIPHNLDVYSLNGLQFMRVNYDYTFTHQISIRMGLNCHTHYNYL